MVDKCPERIIVVRHGERLDKVDRDWSRGADRPHDSPLTENGVAQAKCLGQYLGGVRLLNPRDVVILCSPLTRCVQTAHAIAVGICHRVPDSAKTIPILIEESLCEGVYWLHQDISRNRFLKGEKYPPNPIYHDAAHHRANTSSMVKERCAGLGPAPRFIKTIDEKLSEDPLLSVRCTMGADALLQHKPLFGKAVILVGHGETCSLWARCISKRVRVDSPPYTGFVELMAQPSTHPDAKFGYLWTPQGEVFAAPHLGQAGAPVTVDLVGRLAGSLDAL